MAASHSTPLSDLMSIEEAVLDLAHTGHPVSYSTLDRWLKRAGIPRERIAGTYYYPMSEIYELHRDRIDKGATSN